jgi:hypothetical protein
MLRDLAEMQTMFIMLTDGETMIHPLLIQPTENAWQKVIRLVTERKQQQQLRASKG